MEENEFQLQPGWLGMLDWSNGLPLSRSTYKKELDELKAHGFDYWADWVSPYPNNKEVYSSISSSGYGYDRNETYEYITEKRGLDIHKLIETRKRIDKMRKILNGTYIPPLNNTQSANSTPTSEIVISNSISEKMKTKAFLDEPSDTEQEEDYYYAESDFETEIYLSVDADF